MLCYVLWIVFTLFLLFLLGSKSPVSPGPMVRLLSLLFFSIGLPVPRFSGPLESLCTFFRVTNSKNSTDSSGVHWSGVHWSWYVLKCSLEPLFYALLSIGVLWSPLQLIFRSHNASELNEVVTLASRICHWSPLEWVSFGGAIFSGVHWSGVHWSCWSCWSSYPRKKCTQHHNQGTFKYQISALGGGGGSRGKMLM